LHVGKKFVQVPVQYLYNVIVIRSGRFEKPDLDPKFFFRNTSEQSSPVLVVKRDAVSLLSLIVFYKDKVAIPGGGPATAAQGADPLVGPLLVHCQNRGRARPLPRPRPQLLQGGPGRLHLLLCLRTDTKSAGRRDVLIDSDPSPHPPLLFLPLPPCFFLRAQLPRNLFRSVHVVIEKTTEETGVVKLDQNIQLLSSFPPTWLLTVN
jgi:hypothetical protein